MRGAIQSTLHMDIPMPAYLASQLKELERKGHLPLTWGPAEGPGAYNVMISHWILAGSGSTTA